MNFRKNWCVSLNDKIEKNEIFENGELNNKDKRERKEILISGTKNRYEMKKRIVCPNVPKVFVQRKIIDKMENKFEKLNLQPSYFSSSSLLSLTENFEEEEKQKKEEEDEEEKPKPTNSFLSFSNLYNSAFQLEIIQDLLEVEKTKENKTNVEKQRIEEKLEKEKEHVEEIYEKEKKIIMNLFRNEIMKKIASYKQQDVLKFEINQNSREDKEEKDVKEEKAEDKREKEKNYRIILPPIDLLGCRQKKKKKILQLSDNSHSESLDSSSSLLSLCSVLELIKEKKNKCYYCNQDCSIFYPHVRDTNQWTLDRIDNDKPHIVGNVILACLECNLVRRRRSMKKYEEGKQISQVILKELEEWKTC